MKRKIRLTESDLHRIVMESVQKILSEADPRSWATVASRYDQTDPQKAAYARQRAAQQWNKQYGGTTHYKNGSTFTGYNTKQMSPSGYYVSNKTTKYGQGGEYSDDTENSETLFDPERNTLTDYKWNGYQDGGTDVDEVEGTNRQYQGGDRGYVVARQMAQGNGVYDKNRGGWQ